MPATASMPPMTTPSRHSSIPRYGRAPAACLAVAVPLLLAACGGGGGDGDAGSGFTVGGVVSGLAEGRNLVLQNQGANDLAVAANGSFAMGPRVAAGSAYAIAVASQPAGQRCSVAQGAGTVQAANVADVAVRCETLPAGTQTVGGQVTGLLPGGRLVLQNNQGDDLALTANGRFLFGTPVAGSSAYAVRVLSQPVGQVCTLTNASGPVGNAHVQSVQVACASTTWALPQGDWTGEYCNPSFPDPGQLSQLRIVRRSETRVAVSNGHVAFTTADCSGRGGLYMDSIPQNHETVFDRQESRGDLTAFWGDQLVEGGTSTRVVWVRKGEYLCRLYQDFRTTPRTEYLTLDSVVQGTDKAIALKQCLRPSAY